MDLDSIQLTSATFWQSALLAAVVSAIFLYILTRRIDRARFHQLRWTLVGAAVVFWSGLGVVLIQLTWESYYMNFAAGWMQNGGSLLVTIPLAAAQALLFHWLALRLPGQPVLTFCLLGGVESILEHLWGFYAWKILEIPMLQGVDPISVLAFAFPEYVLYWCVVMFLTFGLGKLLIRKEGIVAQR